MFPSSHVFSFHGSMVCFSLSFLPSLASSQGFFCFLRWCCCRWLLLLQPGKCATSRPRDEDGHLQVRQISIENNARFGWLCRCACWFWLHRSCTFKKRISRIMPRRFTWCRAASLPRLPPSGRQHRTGHSQFSHPGYVRCLGIYAAFFIYGPAAGAATWTHAARQFLP